MLTQRGQSLLVQWFRELFSAASSLVYGDGTPAPSPEHLQRQLVAYIDQCDRQAAGLGGIFLEAYGDVRYAMVAIADELLITNPWSYQQWWQQNLLEEAVQGTYIAGEEFFRRAERILSARRSSEYIEVAKVYLLCLLLGFHGKYRGSENCAERQYLAARLYQYIFDRPAIEGTLSIPLSRTDELQLYPAREIAMFAPSYRRYLMLLGVIGAVVLVTVVAWVIMTAPLRRVIAEIESSPMPMLTPIERTHAARTAPELSVLVNAPGDIVCSVYDRVTGELLLDTTLPAHSESVVRLPSYRQLAILCQSPLCYPVVDTLSTEDTTAVKRRYVLEPLAALVGRPIVLEHIAFEPGSAELTSRSVYWLDALARALATDTSLRITIYGHTDSRGSAPQNLRLSRERAEQVVTYLLRRGIAYERMTAIGKGAQQPRAPNTTEEGRALNRRVELVLTHR